MFSGTPGLMRDPFSERHDGKPALAGHVGSARLLNPALALHILTMIAVKAENGCLQVTIPTEGMTPGEVNDFVSWLRVESVVRLSRLAPEAAWQLSEDMKSEWWQANERPGRRLPISR